MEIEDEAKGLEDSDIHEAIDHAEREEFWAHTVCRGACTGERPLGLALEDSLASLGFALSDYVAQIAAALLEHLDDLIEARHRSTILEIAALRAVLERESRAA